MLSKVKSIVSRLFKIRHQYIFYINNFEKINEIVPKINVKFEEIGFDNIEGVIKFRDWKYVKTFKRFLELGHYGIYAFVDSKAVAHLWSIICRTVHCRINGYMDIYQNEAFIHFCYVKEKYRGKNIYPTMLKILCQKLFSDFKIKRIWIDTETYNIASFKGIEKVGFKPYGKGFYFQFCGHLIFKFFKKTKNKFIVKK